MFLFIYSSIYNNNLINTILLLILFFKVQHKVCNVQDSSWNDEILQFRSRMKDIEIVIENLVNAIFQEIVTVDDGVEALASLYNYSTRKTLKNLFDRKTSDVL